MTLCFYPIIMHPKVIKKSQAVSILEYCLIGFVTRPSDHCARSTLQSFGDIWRFLVSLAVNNLAALFPKYSFVMFLTFCLRWLVWA